MAGAGGPRPALVMTADYHLQISSDAVRKTATAWLILGLASLVGAGIFSLLLVLARTPAVQEYTPFIDFFRVALVVHVNLSVLIWLLSIAGVLWSLSSSRDLPGWDRLSFLLAALGTAIVVIAPFAGAADPLMNNYVPLLRHPLFYIGLGLFTAGIASYALCSDPDRHPPGTGRHCRLAAWHHNVRHHNSRGNCGLHRLLGRNTFQHGWRRLFRISVLGWWAHPAVHAHPAHDGCLGGVGPCQWLPV